MPIEYDYQEEQPVRCILLRVPVVLDVQELASKIVKDYNCPEFAKRIERIEGRVVEFTIEPVFIREGWSHWWPVIGEDWRHHFRYRYREGGMISIIRKVFFTGTFRTDIYYVNANDEVKHFSVEDTFSELIDLVRPQPVLHEDNVVFTLHRPKFDVTWEHIRGSRVRSFVVLVVRGKVIEYRQVYVQACPYPARRCQLKDPGFDQWVGNSPLFWSATGAVAPAGGQTGQGAELGAGSPTTISAVYQTVSGERETGWPIYNTRIKKLTFWAEQLAPATGAVSTFNLTADIRIFDSSGVQVDGASQTWSSNSIPVNRFTQFTLNVNSTERTDAHTVMVRFTFEPNAGNTNTVVIDTVHLDCERALPTIDHKYYGWFEESF